MDDTALHPVKPKHMTRAQRGGAYRGSGCFGLPVGDLSCGPSIDAVWGSESGLVPGLGLKVPAVLGLLSSSQTLKSSKGLDPVCCVCIPGSGQVQVPVDPDSGPPDAL